MAKRTEIRLSISDEQYKFFELLCEQTGMNRSDILRSIVFHYQTGNMRIPYPRDFEAWSAVACEINAIGKNFNQLTRLMNAAAKQGKISSHEFIQLRSSILGVSNQILNELKRLNPAARN